MLTRREAFKRIGAMLGAIAGVPILKGALPTERIMGVTVRLNREALGNDGVNRVALQEGMEGLRRLAAEHHMRVTELLTPKIEHIKVGHPVGSSYRSKRDGQLYVDFALDEIVFELRAACVPA